MLPSVRYKCRFVVIWSVLFLLQQFQLVLLLNINIIGKNANVREKRGFSTNARQNIKSSEKATLKSSSALKNRLKVISRLGPTLTKASKNLPKNRKVSFKNAIYNSKIKPNRQLKKLGESTNKLMRCRRMIKDSCSVPNQEWIKRAFAYKGTTNLPNKWKNQYDELFNKISKENPKFNITSTKQWAVAGIRQSDEYVHSYYSTIDQNRAEEKKPIPIDESKLPNTIVNDKTNVMHTEQDLLSTIDKNNALENCTKETPCEVFLYTKRSPCLQHPQSHVEGCLKYTVSKCKKWFLDIGTRCHVGFEMFYFDNKEVFTSDWDEYFKSFIDNGRFDGKRDKLNIGFSEETVRIADELLKDNVERIRENLVERMAKEGYENLKKSIKFDFRDAYNNALKNFKDETLNMTDLVDKFKQEQLLTIDTTVKDLGKRFENLIDTWKSKYETLVETMEKEGYTELKANVTVDFNHAFHIALQYLKAKTPKTVDLVDKFKKELSEIPKSVEKLSTRFKKLIDDWFAQYARETLNKVATKRIVMSEITKVSEEIPKEVIDFSFYDLN